MAKPSCPKCQSAELVKDGFTKGGWPRVKCKQCGHRPTKLHRSITGDRMKGVKKGTRYVVTSAQNDTPLHRPFWSALLRYCEENAAQLVVIPTRYRNPDSFHTGIAADMTWPQEVRPYLLDKDVKINRYLKIMGDAKINATATDPLSSMDSLSGKCSAIYGHAQVQMRAVATPRNELPKILHTTGTVSLQNYSRSKAGKKAEFHHSFGALVVDMATNRFHPREILADKTGGFYDLTGYYEGGGKRVTTGHKVPGLVLGDEHEKFMPEEVRRAIWGPGGIVPTLRPEVLVRHDMLDCYNGSHHHETDTLLRVAKAFKGDDDLAVELRSLVAHIEKTTPRGTTSAIVQSNHHDHLRQWLNRYDANKDPKNALFAWKLLGQIAEKIEQGEDAEPFRVYLRAALKPEVARRVEFLDPNEPHEIAGIDVSQHGDRGPNGSRGSINAYGKLNRKMIVGHSHSPGIRYGAYQVGVSAPDMAYAVGLSSWLVTHCVIYPNGKRALLHVINGKWRA